MIGIPGQNFATKISQQYEKGKNKRGERKMQYLKMFSTNERVNRDKGKTRFIKVVTHDLSSRFFILEDVENQVFQTENFSGKISARYQ